MHMLSPFHAVVVKEGDRPQTQLTPRGEFLRQGGSDQPRTDNPGAARALVGLDGRTGGFAGARLSEGQADGGQRQQGEAEIRQDDTPRRRVIRAELSGDAKRKQARGEQDPSQS